MSNGFVMWEGPSPIDQAPIMAIVTLKTDNRKTGQMAQVWILRRDVPPTDAVTSGADVSVCGYCPLRAPRGGYKGRACYVQVPNAPLAVWQSYRRGLYGPAPRAWARGKLVRWGAYGDPAMLPPKIVSSVNACALGWTGYTHQWRQHFARWARGVLMASVETPEQEAKARALGWGTFRAGRVDGADQSSAILCAAETGSTCAQCLACNGRDVAIYIPAHGPGRSHMPAHKRALAVLQA